MTGFIPVLTFHSIDDGRAPTSFGPALFARGMETLALGGYRTISLAEAASLAAAKRPFPEKTFVITFDDGYKNVYEKAFPVLAHHSFTATAFLTTGSGERTDDGDRLPSLFGGEMLSWGEIRIMNDAGIDFGAHTLTHPDLTRHPLFAEAQPKLEALAAVFEDSAAMQRLLKLSATCAERLGEA